ncbi:MAG: pantoate kinase [Candidatus Thermoplasmatota archaeon]|nr:pantoate kinase [Candidatus Thermoplasmatota archaeon]
MMARAFSPGHITGFFEICLSDDEEKSGSRGAGLCISLGAMSTVEIGGNATEVIVNGKKGGKVTETALNMLTKKGVKANVNLELPQSQGFGMSGAGTLATALALSSIVSISREEAVKAAHTAEVKCSTGLGDVVSSALGGIEIREEPGFNGKISRIEGGGDIVISVTGGAIETKSILKDEVLGNKISEIGRECMHEILAHPTIENLFFLSKKFSEETGLINAKTKKAVDEACKYGMASMCMLGNSIFAVGNTKEIARALSKYGKVYTCRIDKKEARILGNG